MENPYDQIATYYRHLFSFKNFYDEELVDSMNLLLKERNVKSILDFCCGTGNPCLGLAKNGYNVTASDSSKEMLSVAKENAIKIGVNMDFIILDINSIKIEQTFDCITCHDALYHIDNRDSFRNLLIKFKTLLNKGGCLYFTTKNWNKKENSELRKPKQIYDDILLDNDTVLTLTEEYENATLTVTLLFKNDSKTFSKEFKFEWYIYPQDWIIEQLEDIGFSETRIVNEDVEKKYNCYGILAYK